MRYLLALALLLAACGDDVRPTPDAQVTAGPQPGPAKTDIPPFDAGSP